MSIPSGAKLAYLNSLLPPDPAWPGTGAVELPPDARDWPVTSIPAVNALLAAGVPDSASQIQWITGPANDQNGTGACVAASYCNMGSMYSQLEQGRWEIYDWLQLYHEAGGHQSDGVDSRTAAKIATDQGLPYNGGRRKLFESYTFVQQTPGVFRQQLKAAIATGQLCKLALLLPAPFQWNSGDAPTSGYHEVVTFAYDPIWAWIFNSWSPSWPGDQPAGIPGGIGRVKWDYLEADGLQHNYCYSFVIQPLGGSIPPPPPPPPPPVTIRQVSGTAQGTAQGAGASLLAVGQTLPISSGPFTGTMTIVQITDGVVPPPALTVTGYSPNPVESGHPFTIFGTGFAGSPTVTWGGGAITANRVSDTQISAVAPTVVNANGTAPVVVTVAGTAVTGPSLTVTSSGGGGGGGDLQVNVALGSGRWIYATCKDRQTQEYLTATCHASIDGFDLGVSTTTKQAPTALAARWYVGRRTGKVVVNVSTSDHRTGTGTLQV